MKLCLKKVWSQRSFINLYRDNTNSLITWNLCSFSVLSLITPRASQGKGEFIKKSLILPFFYFKSMLNRFPIVRRFVMKKIKPRENFRDNFIINCDCLICSQFEIKCTLDKALTCYVFHLDASVHITSRLYVHYVTYLT